MVDIDSSCIVASSFCKSIRGNSFKLAKFPVASKREKNFFTNRTVNIWNSLPDSIVTSRSVSGFKRSLGRFDFSQFFMF